MRSFVPYALIAAAVAATVSFSYWSGLFFGTEHFLEDLLVSRKPVDERIVIAAIDDESLKKIGQWPWPRSVFAEAFSNLNKAKPLAVGFDVVLAEPSRQGTADDARLSEVLRRISYPLIMPVEGALVRVGSAFKFERLTEPLRQFFGGSTVEKGHVNLILDPDGVVRRVPVTANDGTNEVKSLAVVLAEKGGASAEETELSVAYAAAPGEIRRIPFYRLLEEDMSAALRGKIILIGATSPDLHDEKRTPLSEGAEMPGVEIQANITNMLLKNYRLTPLSDGLSLIFITLLALLPVVLFSLIENPWKPLFAAALFGAALNVGIILLYEQGIVMNIIHHNLSLVLSTMSVFSYRYYVEAKEKRELKGAFSKYVSSQVLDKILEDPSRLELGGEEKQITVLFSDIRGFTTLSERSTPHELVRILNRYFTLMTGEVQKYGGVLDKYIGDAVMAFWGAPLADPAQADNAFRAAEGMLERLREFNRELKKEKGIEIDIGIGLYTGPAVVGNIGSDQRFDYTAMGDTVNVASRLEGLNKEYKTHLIVGQTTKEALTVAADFKEIGGVQVKGRNEPIKIYALSEK